MLANDPWPNLFEESGDCEPFLEGGGTQQRSQSTPTFDCRLITEAFEQSEIDYKLPTIIFPMSTIVAFIKALLTIYNTGVVPLPTMFDWKHQRSLIF